LVPMCLPLFWPQIVLGRLGLGMLGAGPLNLKAAAAQVAVAVFLLAALCGVLLHTERPTLQALKSAWRSRGKGAAGAAGPQGTQAERSDKKTD
jgi:hypothetical protein